MCDSTSVSNIIQTSNFKEINFSFILKKFVDQAISNYYMRVTSLTQRNSCTCKVIREA